MRGGSPPLRSVRKGSTQVPQTRIRHSSHGLTPARQARGNQQGGSGLWRDGYWKERSVVRPREYNGNMKRMTRKAKVRQSTVVIEQDEDGYYVATVPSLPSCHTQARTLQQLAPRIREVIALCLSEQVVSNWQKSGYRFPLVAPTSPLSRCVRSRRSIHRQQSLPRRFATPED